MEIAVEAGFLYGAQIPSTVYAPLYFADQNWKKPDRAAYMKGLDYHRPTMATVLDWEEDEQLDEVLDWAHEAAQYVKTVVIIPKVSGGVPRLPRTIDGAEVRLGYSVPTRFGGTMLQAWEFAGWPVHLLGGSPQRQMELARYLRVHSADGNYHQKMAVRYGQFWAPGNARGCQNRYWPRLSEVGWGDRENVPYEAFRRSCVNIRAAWIALTDTIYQSAG